MVWLNLQELAGRYSRQFSLPYMASFHSFPRIAEAKRVKLSGQTIASKSLWLQSPARALLILISRGGRISEMRRKSKPRLWLG
jgi:hypothetical protein